MYIGPQYFFSEITTTFYKIKFRIKSKKHHK